MCCFVKTDSFDCCGHRYDLENGARLVAHIGLGHGLLSLVASVFLFFLWVCDVLVVWGGEKDDYDDAWYSNFWITLLVLQLAHLPMSLMLLRGISKPSSALVKSYLVVKMLWIFLNFVGCFVFVAYGFVLTTGVKNVIPPPETPDLPILKGKYIALKFLLAFILLVASVIESRFWSVVYSYVTGGMMQQQQQSDNAQLINDDVIDQQGRGGGGDVVDGVIEEERDPVVAGED